jgi:isopenicillin N synthase-like dioxygenase
MATSTLTAAAEMPKTTKSTTATTKTTELEVVNYERLSARDKNEIKKLVHAATTRGIFFLDTNGPSAAQVTADIPQILNAQRKFFDLPLQEKRAFETSVPERG